MAHPHSNRPTVTSLPPTHAHTHATVPPRLAHALPAHGGVPPSACPHRLCPPRPPTHARLPNPTDVPPPACPHRLRLPASPHRRASIGRPGHRGPLAPTVLPCPAHAPPAHGGAPPPACPHRLRSSRPPTCSRRSAARADAARPRRRAPTAFARRPAHTDTPPPAAPDTTARRRPPPHAHRSNPAAHAPAHSSATSALSSQPRLSSARPRPPRSCTVGGCGGKKSHLVEPEYLDDPDHLPRRCGSACTASPRHCTNPPRPR
ncbi:proline-rich receptor-like protein kinase PERK9 [Miscanthus floridulus]|uniref:proline-rich receptor-like protein kinase PERK9 n=1 Tax=Miscanthus floridulus TaxID=154761 RepID=UPI0034596744